MRHIILIVGVVLISTSSFAQNISPLDKLNAAWKNHTAAQLNKQDEINIVYGGVDISRRPTLASHMTLA